MIIKSIDLKNFRNYEIEHIEFDEKTNIFYGDNAQGKTNVLEAIFISATSKSHKGSKDIEIINFNHDEAHIKTIVSKKNIDYRIDMHIKKNRSKGIAINGIPVKKVLELYGVANIIFFSPEDLNIIKNGPSGRRKFIDMELCQLNKIYASDLINYNKCLEQRNKLLKDISFNSGLIETLDIWDDNLIKYGVELINHRKEFISKLNDIIMPIHNKLSGQKEILSVSYEPSVESDIFTDELRKFRDKDIRLKMTEVGPHRDDILFMINGVDIRKYGSQGQQRTTALSLKLAEIELVKEITGDSPILLLDDVLSELDSNRQNYLLNSINDVQTIITCTGLDEFINNRFAINSVFKVIDGKVFKEN